MTKFLNPSGVVKPFSKYSHVANVPGNYRWVHISGQVGATPEGKLLEGFEEQARQTWHNIIGWRVLEFATFLVVVYLVYELVLLLLAGLRALEAHPADPTALAESSMNNVSPTGSILPAVTPSHVTENAMTKYRPRLSVGSKTLWQQQVSSS